MHPWYWFFTCLIFPIPFENTNRSLLMVGYDPRMPGIGSNRSANCAAAVCPNQAEIYKISWGIHVSVKAESFRPPRNNFPDFCERWSMDKDFWQNKTKANICFCCQKLKRRIFPKFLSGSLMEWKPVKIVHPPSNSTHLGKKCLMWSKWGNMINLIIWLFGRLSGPRQGFSAGIAVFRIQ